jgi:D-amino-acid dehydrogenase
VGQQSAFLGRIDAPCGVHAADWQHHMTEIIVLGAGMVGVSTALALQAKGHSVTLLDRRGPGEETSYGNAGMIQAEAVEPYPLPLDVKTLWSIATGRTNDVVWRFKDLPSWLVPLLGYARSSLPTGYKANIAPVWSKMILSATDDHAPLIAASGAEAIISRRGYRKAYRTEEGLAKAVATAERYRAQYGVPSTVMTGSELSQAEPNLKTQLAGAVHWTGSWFCEDPGGLVRRYADLFMARGGSMVLGDAMSLERAGAGWKVQSNNGPLTAGRVVVCLGPWSPALLARFGHAIPMVLKRGYHRHFQIENGPDLPLYDVETGTFLSPMRRGLRVLTGAELTTLDGPPSMRQMDRSTAAARELFALGEPVEADAWRGTRPFLPGMLPMIGPSDKNPGMWFNFGHGHQGFTLGPTSARILAAQMVR